jgi:chemotaxis-related protein WspD
LGIEPHGESPSTEEPVSAPGGQTEAAEPPVSARLIVTEHEGQRWVFPVDEVAGIHRVGVDRLADVPATVAKSPKSFSRAVFVWERRSVGYLAEDRLFESLRGSIQ